jgi:uncharacterized LabA/DUF88 family protein
LQPLYAILLDGGFVTKVLSRTLSRFPNAADIQKECNRIAGLRDLPQHDLLRIYFYDAAPATGVYHNPVDGSRLDLGNTPVYSNHKSLIDQLELSPNFAVRLGVTMMHGWRLGDRASTALAKAPRAPIAKDFVPDIEQKGVDLRIGLDIARLALREMVRTIVVVTADSDLVPAFKFARREGVRIYLDTLGQNPHVRRELKAHCDIAL